MVITVKTPYQIFSKNELPVSWEKAFQINLENWPFAFQSQLNSAWDVASKANFPSRKDESWRWMDYKQLDFESLELNSHISPVLLTVRHIRENDEQSVGTGSLPNGIVITTLREFLASDTDLAIKLLSDNAIVNEGLFAALPSALASDGLVVYVPRGVSVEGVVQCFLEVSLENSAAFTRNLIWLEEGAEINLELIWLNQDVFSPGFHNGILNVHLDDRSILHLDERQQFDLSSWNITHQTASLGMDAQLNWNYAAIGSKISKNFIRVELEGKGSQTNLHGVMFPTDKQVINLDTRQNHWAEQTYSDLMYKSVASKEGRSIWHGMIYVDPKAKNTDAYQSNRNLVLDGSADVKSVPGLEILNDDVKCSHGATVGDIDEEEMYYLQTRGIPTKEAELLIVEGFFNEVIQSFKVEETRNELIDKLIKKMIQ